MAANEFGEVLSRLRRKRGLTQAALAGASGLSAGTVGSYEEGRRRPSASTVERLASAMHLDNGEHDELRAAAGLRPAAAGLEAALQKARAPADSVWDEVQESPWVAMVLNERREIVAWNPLANRTSDRDLGTLDQFHRSIFRMAATEHYDRHLLNWDELIGRLIAVFKTEGNDITSGDANSFVQAIIESIGREDSRFLPRIFALYLNAEPWDEARRNIHPVRWRLDDGTLLAFRAAFTDWSQYDGLWAFDWHAADAATAEWVNSNLGGTGWASERPPTPPFSEAIGAYRQAARLSRARLGELAGMAPATIAAYESARRSPSREAILALCRVLYVDAYAINRFLREAGYEEEPGDWARWICGEKPETIYRDHTPLRPVGSRAIFGETDRLPFPSLILDNGCHVVHANPTARRLVDLRAHRPIGSRPGPHLLQLMVSDQLQESIGNWEEAAGVFLPGRLEHLVLGGGR
ncbi:MAG: helix-turn-helix domain-containing protein, partial [Dehalococcoidia bacterium]|nr:helix-turn-helix domain-containing protein [Dehalococcoidia bacterium]